MYVCVYACVCLSLQAQSVAQTRVHNYTRAHLSVSQRPCLAVVVRVYVASQVLGVIVAERTARAVGASLRVDHGPSITKVCDVLARLTDGEARLAVLGVR